MKPALTDAQLDRYARHILLRQIGGAGQRKLLDAAVLVVGAGGIGAPALLYLAAAGVGRIGIVDDDTVALSNLQRQILYATGEVGTAKLDAALQSHLDALIGQYEGGQSTLLHRASANTGGASGSCSQRAGPPASTDTRSSIVASHSTGTRGVPTQNRRAVTSLPSAGGQPSRRPGRTSTTRPPTGSWR